MPKKRIVTDAPESNAGDDFHVLWSVRKSLELINFNQDGLKAITLENGVFKDANELDPDGNLMLGVDLGEYYGGEDFSSASKLVFSQLKYSTRHSVTNWTISSICQGKKTKYAGSIIERLAGVYTAHINSQSRADVLSKLKLKLVSNRPFAPADLAIINACQTLLAKHLSPLALTKLKAGFDASYQNDIANLQAASGLPAAKFTDFLRLLDFNDCGTGARHVLKEDAINAIARVNSIESARNFDTLHVKVWNKMMPESREDNKLTLIDILKAFNISSTEQLLPVPAKLDMAATLIAREQSNDVIKEINAAGIKTLCLHGGAGSGKSSMVRLITNGLPEGSVAVVFDCYGAGSYLDPIDHRHKPQWALMQLSNELAMLAGSPFMLLPPNLPAEYYLREFLDRIKAAGQILKVVHPEALLLIIIDAADNSVTAANNAGERSFVNDLVNTKIPDGVRLLVTTRSHRMPMLELPPTTIPIELLPFRLPETTKRLEPIFPDATAEEIAAFHRLTNGIPRVQTYALVNRHLGIEALLEPLKPGGKTVDDIIQQNLEFVKSKLGDRSLVDKVLSFLIILPRPIPLALLSRLSGAEEAVILDMVTDIDQGIIQRDEALMFSDENFETYLGIIYPETKEILEAIAEELVKMADINGYASKNLGNFLLRTGRYTDLKEIVFLQKHLIFPKDPVILKEIAVERTRQAMKLSLEEADSVDFLKLQVIAAEAAKTNDKLTETLLANADLTALYGDRQTVENLYFRSNKLSWYGSVHFRCAAVYARKPELRRDALAHFKAAESWLDWRNRSGLYRSRAYEMTILDLAFAGEAACRLQNAEKGLEWLWQNCYPVYPQLTAVMLQNLLNNSQLGEVDQVLSNKKWSFRGKINIIPIYFRSGRKVPFDTSSLIDDIMKATHGRRIFKKRTKRQLVMVAEYLAYHGTNVSQIAELLSYTILPNPQSFPRFYSNDNDTKELVELDTIFRSLSLNAVISDTPLTIDAFYAPIYREGTDEKKRQSPGDYESQEKSRIDILFRPMLPLYLLRAKFLCGKIDEAILLTGIQGQMVSFERDYQVYSYHRELRYYKSYYVRVFSDLLAYVEDKNRLVAILVEGFAKKDNDISVRLGIADQCSLCVAAHPVALTLLNEADKLIFNAQTDAGGKISDFLRCVRIGGRLDQSVGLAYFKKMVDTVSEMDIEGFDQIRFTNELAGNCIIRHPRTAYEFSRFTEYAHSRLKDWDGFPWREAITGISRLDHYASMAALTRWDHLHFVRFGGLVLPAIQNGLIKGFVPRELAAGLVNFDTDFGVAFETNLSLIFTGLNDPAAAAAIGRSIFKLIVHECPRYHQSTLVTLLGTLLTTAECKDEDLKSEMTEFLSFWSSMETEREREYTPATRKDVFLPDTIDPADCLSVRTLLESFEAKNDGTGPKEVLEAIRKTCRIGQYLDFLNLLVSIDGTQISYYERQTLLEETLTIWKAHPAIGDWKAQNFEKFLQGAFPAYLEHEDLMNTPNLDEIARIFEVGVDILSKAVKKALPLYIDSLSAREIYQLVKYTGAGLNEDRSVKVIEWALSRWNEKISADTLGTLWHESLLLPDDPIPVLGGAFRYLLGHPRKALRWQAAHALRLIADCGNIQLLSFLLSEQDKQKCDPFQHASYTYFWISAKLWLWMVLAKLARDTPASVSALAAAGPAQLLQSSLPHALVYHLAQQFSLALENSAPGTYDHDHVNFIQSFLNPRGGTKVEISKSKPKARDEEKLIFRFDTTDTVPYWYQPLCTVFSVSYQTIPTMADEVISNEWNYRGDVYKDDHVNSDDDDYSSTSNGHGAIPAVENLRKYYEFHAMFCVAFKLLQTARPDRTSAFNAWINHWVSTYDGRWLADLRDFVPLEKVFGTDHRSDDWQTALTDERLLSWMQFNSTKPVVMADIKLYYGDDYESINIDSALVAADKGESLLRALQTMPFHRYRLPEADEDHHEIDEPGFELKGWLNRIGGRNEVFDRLDTAANSIKQSYIYPGGLFEELHPGLTASDDFRCTLGNGFVIGHHENWDGSESYKDDHRVTSEGQRYRIDIAALLKFLKLSGFSLILECQVNRRLGHDRYEMEERIKNDKKNIYLIESDGTVKTVAGNFKIG